MVTYISCRYLPYLHLPGYAHLQPPRGQQLTEGPTVRLPPVARRSEFQRVRDQSLQCAMAPRSALAACAEWQIEGTFLPALHSWHGHKRGEMKYEGGEGTRALTHTRRRSKNAHTPP